MVFGVYDYENESDLVMRDNVLIKISIVVGMFVIWNSLFAQIQPSKGENTSVLSNAVRFSGDIGSDFELYSISGRERRRPPASARLYINSNFEIFKTVTLSANAFISNEGNSLNGSTRQNLNRYELNPTWSWGSAHIGDFSKSYSQFTLNGIQVRGGELSLYPGIFRFSILGGQVQRAIFSSNSLKSYDRNIYGGKIGIGKEESSFFDLLFLRAADDRSSIKQEAIDTTSLVDSTDYSEQVYRLGTTPKENMVVSAISKVSMLDKKIIWKGEFSGSVYTRDLNASKLNQQDALAKIPKFVQNIYTPRTSSNVDIAFTTELYLSIKNISTQLGYKYIGPGYVSLGLASLLNDNQNIYFKTSMRRKEWSINFNGYHQNDNLINQKTYTTTRNNLGSAITLKPLKRLNSSFNVNYSNMQNNSSNSSAKIDYSNWRFGTNHVYSQGWDHLINNIVLNYMFQTSGDKYPRRFASKFKTHSLNLNISINATTKISVTPSINFINTRNPIYGWQLTSIYSIGARYNALRNKWISSFTIAYTDVDQVNTWQGRFHSTYRLTKVLSIKLMIRSMNYRSTKSTISDFNEYSSRLGITYRL